MNPVLNTYGKRRLFFVLCLLSNLCSLFSWCLFFRSCFLFRKSCLDAQADSSLFRVDLHDLDLDCLADLEFITYVLNSLVSDLGNVNQSIKSCFEFYECTVLLGLNNLSVEYIAYLVLVPYKSPRFRLSLLESERDLALFLVE